ncbi:MAG: DUF308 domain-containing protein [Anaerolineae bacterium]|jgi:uncharacterized membrane protein HdeD (DUF308 family)|nr:DUF308 domain-containing protein [Anaerolineae bacterium]
MTTEIKSKVTDGAKQAAPWRKGIPWGIVLAEGVLLVAVGLFLIFAQDAARRLLGQILAIVIGVTGGIQLYGALRAKQEGQLGQLNTIRGAVGLGAGALVLVLFIFNLMTLQTGRIILGLGAVAFGAIGIYLIYLTRDSGIRIGPAISNGFWVLFGILLLLAAIGGTMLASISEAINVVLLLGGAFLIIWAFVIKGSKKSTPVN